MPLTYEQLLAQGEKAADALVSQAYRDIVANYKVSLAAIRAQLAEIHAKYNVNGKLTYAEMSKYRRLESLFDGVNAELKALTDKTSRLMNRLGSDAYEEGFYRTAYAVEAPFGVTANWGILQPEAIAASVQNPISGLTLSERLAVNRVAIVTKIKSEVTQSLIQGEGYPKMAARIKDALGGDATKAMRVARTEGHRNTQAGKSAAYDYAEDLGVDLEREWSSTLDDRVREAHGVMDGQKADKDGYFHAPTGEKALYPGAFGVASLDISCRCSLIARIKGHGPKFRRIRGEGVVPYKTYSEWKASKTA